MNLKQNFLGISLLLSGTAVAAPPIADKFPDMLPIGNVPVEQQNIHKAPLNPMKDAGVKIFGYTSADYYGTPNYLELYSGNAQQLNKLTKILIPGSRYDDDYPDMLGVIAGSWAGDCYYAYRNLYYSYEITRMYDYIKVDRKTGKSEQVYIWNESGSANPSWWTSPQATMWNPNKPDDFYALAQNTDGTITSVIKKIDKSTGRFTEQVTTLGKYYFSAAYNYDNQLYALTWKTNSNNEVIGTLLDILDPADNYKVISSNEIKVDGKPWEIYYDNSITVDYTTGDIWWAAAAFTIDATNMFQVNKGLIKIDPTTFETENFGKMGYNEMLGGLSIEYVTAESRYAPAQISNVNFQIDPQGNNAVTLSWTNPQTCWNRRNLNNLTSVEIYRDAYPGTPVETVAATGKEGTAMSWTDNSASQGIHTYYIVPVNTTGKGVPYKLDAFVGKDVPGPINNINASTSDGKTIQLTWEKPSRGDNDGWFDDSDLSYTITRLPDNKNLGTVKTTSFNDTQIDEVQLFSYVIVASNAQGSGSEVESNQVMAGNGIRPPFSTTFETKADANRFIVIDKNRDGVKYEYGFNTLSFRESYKILYSEYDNDDILVSPALILEKGKTYKVVFRTILGSYNDQESWPGIPTPLRIIGGTSPTESGLTDILKDDPKHTNDFPTYYEDNTVYFVSPVDGEYYIGYETLMSDMDFMWLYMEGFSIEEAPSDDLEARAVNSYLYLSTIEDNEFEVEIYNNGDKDQTNYHVALALLDKEGKPNEFYRTSDVPVLNAYESAFIKIQSKVPFVGEQQLVAVVDLLGDGNPTNNMTAPITVQCDETHPLNYTFDGDYLPSVISNVPFNHNYPCTASQTIYTPAMTLLNRVYPNQTPKITRIAWEGNSLRDVETNDDTELKVYMSQTNYEGFESANLEFLPIESDPLFNDRVTLKTGFNYVVADFEEDFEFDPSRPLVVTVLKEDRKHSGFLFGWRSFDADWYNELLHSVFYGGNNPIDLKNPSGDFKIYADAPVLHLAIVGDKNGLSQIVMTGQSAIMYNPATSSVETEGYEIASVEVYNQAGQLMERVESNGGNSVRINTRNGLYIIKVNGIDGTSKSIKTIF